MRLRKGQTCDALVPATVVSRCDEVRSVMDASRQLVDPLQVVHPMYRRIDIKIRILIVVRAVRANDLSEAYQGPALRDVLRRDMIYGARSHRRVQRSPGLQEDPSPDLV